MDIKSLHEGVKINPDTGLYNLFTPTFIFNNTIALSEHIVTKDEEMRIDLIFANMYLIEPSMMSEYYQDIDVLLYINNIDNPLNIKEGMLLYYPAIDDIYRFRYTPSGLINDTSITKQLGVPNTPNKATRTDKSRQNYIENDYSLSPVVLDTPREPVRIENGRFSIGGL